MRNNESEKLRKSDAKQRKSDAKQRRWKQRNSERAMRNCERAKRNNETAKQRHCETTEGRCETATLRNNKRAMRKSEILKRFYFLKQRNNERARWPYPDTIHTGSSDKISSTWPVCRPASRETTTLKNLRLHCKILRIFRTLQERPAVKNEMK